MSRQIDQEIIQATDELKKDVALTTDIVTGNENTVVEVAPGNTVRSPKKMIEDCYQETQQAIEQKFGSLDQAVNDATAAADRADSASQSSSGSAGDSATSATTASQKAQEAKASATEAASSKQAAADSATQAAISASHAKTSETAASQSANDAATSATTSTEKSEQATQSAAAATQQATRAQAWAANSVDDLVEGELYSSLHYARQSSDSATNSSTSADRSGEQATLAQQSMESAASSEQQAGQYKTQAQDFAEQAKSSQDASLASQEAAANSQTAAKASETAAANSAASALNSKNSAASSASTAAQQADRSTSEANRAKSEADRVSKASSRIVGEICRFSFDTSPPGFFALDGSTIPNGKTDYFELANCGSRFVLVSGNDLVLKDFVDFGRGKGSSFRKVGDFEQDSIRQFDIAIDFSGSSVAGSYINRLMRSTSGTGSFGRNVLSDIANAKYVNAFFSDQTQPRSLTELVCIYHGVI